MLQHCLLHLNKQSFNVRSRIFRTMKVEEVCFHLFDIIGKQPYCIYEKQQQTVEFVLLLGFTIMAAEEIPYLPGP